MRTSNVHKEKITALQLVVNAVDPMACTAAENVNDFYEIMCVYAYGKAVFRTLNIDAPPLGYALILGVDFYQDATSHRPFLYVL